MGDMTVMMDMLLSAPPEQQHYFDIIKGLADACDSCCTSAAPALMTRMDPIIIVYV